MLDSAFSVELAACESALVDQRFSVLGSNELLASTLSVAGPVSAVSSLSVYEV